MASSSYSAPPPPVFSGENYPIWSVKMKAYLKAYDLWEVVETGRDPPPLRDNATVAQMKQHSEECAKKFKALSCLHSAVSDVIFTRIMACESAKEAWDKLKEEFQGSDKTRSMQILNLRREFEVLKMKDSESVKEYSDRLLSVVNKIRLLGEELSDKRVVEKVLVSLPERFEPKISSLEDSKNLSTISLSELVNALQALEQRRTFRMEESSEEAFLVKQKGKLVEEVKKAASNSFNKGKQHANRRKGGRRANFPPCPTCNKTNHLEKDCWQKSGVKPPQCGYCKKLGHVDKNCRLKQYRQNQNHNQQPAQQLNYHDDQAQCDDHIFAVTHSSNTGCRHTWLVDSGCTCHMARDESLFSSIDKSVRVKVKLGNGEIVESQGKGSVYIQTKQGIKLVPDVLFIPSLDQNLLSVAQMMKKGYSLSFKDNVCSIFDSHGAEIVKVNMVGNSFPLNWNSVQQHTSYIARNAESDLWHKRFGHYNLNSLKYMQSKEMVRDMPEIFLDGSVCGNCQLGKSHRQSFPDNATWRAKEKLELVHTDVCGPMRTASMSNNLYFILFIDDLTRMTWVYFLTNKSQVFSVFKKFKALVERQSSCKLKTLRSDNGTEYTSGEFNKFCEDLGIKHQFSVSYSPEQNGVSERKNRTVMEMARCMMIEKKLPKNFWAEAVHTAVYLLNRLPTRSVQGMTPVEAWFGSKPSAKHVKVFGSACYIHVPAVKRGKLDDKAEIGIFLGYAAQSKGYRVYKVEAKKVVVCRDVKIDEDAYWNWKTNQVEYCCSDQQQTRTVPAVPESDSNFDTDSDFDSPPLRTKSLAEIYESCNLAISEPSNYVEASTNDAWIAAMQEEIGMINKNETWILTPRPQNRRVIGVKWVYRVKLNPDGSVFKYKARLVVKGYAQVPGIDYGDTFAPVARHDTVRLLIALAAQNKWKIFHLDIKSAFLNGNLEEEIFVEQPEGFEIAGCKDHVYKLNKALYGLKQAPRAWYSRMDSHLLDQGFQRSPNEPTLYVKHTKGKSLLIVSLYVDDLLVTGDNLEEIQRFKERVMHEFEMSDLGLMKYFLGIEVDQSESGIFISQHKYALDMLKKFSMENCKSVATPLVLNEKLHKDDGEPKVEGSTFRSLIGSLLYLTATRPDLMFSASLLSRFMQSPSQKHFGVAKRVLRYLKGTANYGIYYTNVEDATLIGYSDSDWAGCLDDYKSTSGYVFSFGSGAFTWNSRKQDIVAQSTAEAEYVAAASTANQAIWLRKILFDLQQPEEEPTTIFVDNKSAISIAENPVQHGRTKHINVKFHALREAEKNGEIKLVHCTSNLQQADIFTKALPRAKLEFMKSLLGVSKNNLKEEC